MSRFGESLSVAVVLQTSWEGGRRVNLGFDQGYYKNGGGFVWEWAEKVLGW